ncbi:IAP-3 protein [Gynaephora ruoergensis nucleopolyhedrovirus]|nr:IAP-3 protein [Gynaephora ruoergensis nucleopolyhedrovirus]
MKGLTVLDLKKSSELRLNTFWNWPTSFHLSAEEMAKAGFKYLGHGCVVECVFCGLTVRDWPLGSDAMSEHKRYSSDCRFVLKAITRAQEPSERHSQIILENVVDNAIDEKIGELRCAVCLDAERQIMFEPCRHVVCCDACSRLIIECVVCRALVFNKILVYLN